MIKLNEVFLEDAEIVIIIELLENKLRNESISYKEKMDISVLRNQLLKQTSKQNEG